VHVSYPHTHVPPPQDSPGYDEYRRQDLEVAQRFTEPTGRCKAAYEAYFCWVNFPRCDINTNQSLPMCRSACENMFEICGYPEEMWRCGEAEYFNAQIEKNNPVGEPELSTKSLARAMDERNAAMGRKTNAYQDKIIELGYHPAYLERYEEENAKDDEKLYTYTSQSGLDTKDYFPGQGVHPAYTEGEDTYLRDFFPGQPFKSQQCDGKDEDGECNDLPTCTPGFKGSASTKSYALALAFSSTFALIAFVMSF
jgi:hypothetical protein